MGAYVASKAAVSVSSGDLAIVQQPAGHASPATTSRYDRRPEATRRRAADRHGNAPGRPNVYRPTPQLLQVFGGQTLEELREGMGITTPAAADLWIAEDMPGRRGVEVGEGQGQLG